MAISQPAQPPPDASAHVLSQFSLKGKVAAVTGGSRGIGLEVVKGLAEAGADVALIYRTTEDAPEKAASIAKANGVHIKAYRADVTIRDSIMSVLDTVARDFGHLDIVVVNAGVCSNIKNLDYTEESWHHINSVNYDGAMWTAQAAGKIFKAQGRGNLVITASVSSVLVNYPQEQAAYNASKAAVAHLGKCLAMEWAAFARVNMVSPGYIATESTSAPNSTSGLGILESLLLTSSALTVVLNQAEPLRNGWLAGIPQKRIAKPEELKALYTFLASDACPYMTGSNIIVDGAYSCI
ncbi:hypothetical protein BP6252_11835 [Coleophoma cylindrospora]|uniref:Uncharacterized protein n=1 Tax=Coleophoma cylindrospora TaxID=1849047 RepID=A0A3D8QKS8_9HELO|nr:hypothetical protein BP6252_11835 [Coleophoma cylindrospora]